MSTVDGIGAQVSGATSSGGIGELTSDEFLKLIFTELSNQDPLEPNDTNALLQQIANIRSIQSDVDLVERLGDLVGQNELSAGASLIGRMVSGVTDANQRVSGLVQSVSRTTTGVVLGLQGGARIPMSSLDRVLEGEQAGEGTAEEAGS